MRVKGLIQLHLKKRRGEDRQKKTKNKTRTQNTNLQLKWCSLLIDTPLNFTQGARWTGVGAQQLLLPESPAVKLHHVTYLSLASLRHLRERKLDETNRRPGGEKPEWGGVCPGSDFAFILTLKRPGLHWDKTVPVQKDLLTWHQRDREGLQLALLVLI